MLLIDGMQYSFNGKEYTVIANSKITDTVFVLDNKDSGVEQFLLSSFTDSAKLLDINSLVNCNITVVTTTELVNADLGCDLILLPELKVVCSYTGDDWQCKSSNNNYETYINYYIEQHGNTPAICCTINFTFKE